MLPASTRVPHLGQRHVDDVAERVLGVVGDADPDRALVLARGAHPLVLGGVLQVVGVQAGLLGSAQRSRAAAGYCGRARRTRRCVGSTTRLDVERAAARRPPARRRPPRAGRSGRAGTPAPPPSVAGSPITSMTYGGSTSVAVDQEPAGRRPRTTVCATTRTSPLICIASAPAVRSSWTVSRIDVQRRPGRSTSVMVIRMPGPVTGTSAGQDAQGVGLVLRLLERGLPRWLVLGRRSSRVLLEPARSRSRRAGWCRRGR